RPGCGELSEMAETEARRRTRGTSSGGVPRGTSSSAGPSLRVAARGSAIAVLSSPGSWHGMKVTRAAFCLGALALGGCFYSSEAGKTLETRVDKLDKDLRAEQKAQAEKLDQQLPRIDQKIAEVTKALDSLDQASRRSGADTSVQLQKVIE